MKLGAYALAAFVALGAAACGGGGGGIESPTAPSGSNGGGGSTGGGCSVPAAPTGLAASVNGSLVVFTWSSISSATDYEIRVGSSPGTGNVLATNTTQANYTWNGGARGTYYARVNARNACGSGNSSQEVSFTIAA